MNSITMSPTATSLRNVPSACARRTASATERKATVVEPAGVDAETTTEEDANPVSEPASEQSDGATVLSEPTEEAK